MKYENIQELLANNCCMDMDEYSSWIYKITECGAYAEYDNANNRIQYGTIVEGSDAEYTSGWMEFPLDEDEIENAIDELETLADAEWRRANLCHYLILAKDGSIGGKYEGNSFYDTVDLFCRQFNLDPEDITYIEAYDPYDM